jgi:hypothetical protein
MKTKPNYAAYWAAALKRHQEHRAAGCIPPVAAKRVGKGREEHE